jgi:hypothetical protein
MRAFTRKTPIGLITPFGKRMKTIEISDQAFDVISSCAVTHANGNIVAYIDRLVGVIERRLYEELPIDVEFDFLARHHPEQLDNAQAACAILELIRTKAPRRFETVIGFRFPNRDKIVLSRNPEELGKRELVYRIGDSDCYLFGGLDYKSFREMLHEIYITLGYSVTLARTLERYIRKKGEGHTHIFQTAMDEAPFDPSAKAKAETRFAITKEARMLAEEAIKTGLAQMLAEKLSAYLGTNVEADAESLARAISARNRKIDAEMKAKLRTELGFGPV